MSDDKDYFEVRLPLPSGLSQEQLDSVMEKLKHRIEHGRLIHGEMGFHFQAGINGLNAKEKIEAVTTIHENNVSHVITALHLKDGSDGKQLFGTVRPAGPRKEELRELLNAGQEAYSFGIRAMKRGEELLITTWDVVAPPARSGE